RRQRRRGDPHRHAARPGKHGGHADGRFRPQIHEHRRVSGRALRARRHTMLRHRLAAAAVAALALEVGIATADDCPVAQYRWSKDMGQIQITTGTVERPSDLDARKATWERSGLVVLESDAGRAFTRKEMVPGHSIETTIRIAPPAGHGEGGAS